MISTMSILRSNEKLKRALAVLFALCVWQAAAMLLNEPLLLASPVQVAGRLFSLILTASFWKTVGYTALRIVSGFLMGFLAGIVLAVLAGRFKWLEILLWPFVVTIKSIPVASFVILVLIWLSSRHLSVFISFLMVFPVIYLNTLQGLKATDSKMLEMAKLYRLPFARRLKYIYVPQVQPFLYSACSIALGLSWKSGVAAELIGRPDLSLGDMLYMAKVHMDTADVFAWTVVIILLSQLFEKLFLMLMKKGFDGVMK